jgi:hypothetical protein
VSGEAVKLRWEIEGSDFADLPEISTTVDAGSVATVIGPYGSKVANVNNSGFMLDLPFPMMFLFVMTIGAICGTIVAIVIFTILYWTEKLRNRATYNARIGATEINVVPIALTQGTIFQQT